MFSRIYSLKLMNYVFLRLFALRKTDIWILGKNLWNSYQNDHLCDTTVMIIFDLRSCTYDKGHKYSKKLRRPQGFARG